MICLQMLLKLHFRQIIVRLHDCNMNVIDQSWEPVSDINILDLRQAKWAVNGKFYLVSRAYLLISRLCHVNGMMWLLPKPFKGHGEYVLTNHPYFGDHELHEVILRHILEDEQCINVICE